MDTFLTVGWSEEHNPTLLRLRDALDRIEEYQGEEGLGLSLTSSDTEWSLCTFADGRTVWMNLSCEQLGRGHLHHMLSVSREKVLKLWELLMADDIAEIEQESWLPGHR